MWFWRIAFVLFSFLACLSLADVLPSANPKAYQYFSISGNSTSCNGSPVNCDLSLMQEYIFPGTHNSATSKLKADFELSIVGLVRSIECTTECQKTSVAQQFRDGIRAFHFEVCDALDVKERLHFFNRFQRHFADPVPYYTNNDPVICHGSDVNICKTSEQVHLWGYGPLLSIVFQDLANELKKTSNQVIRILLEFQEGNTTAMLDRTVEIFSNIFCENNQNCPIAIQFSELYNKNPTLGELTANGTNRILLTNPSLTYTSSGTTSQDHYNVPWVLQDYLACDYDGGSNITEVIDHQQNLCKSNITNTESHLCTYYHPSDQVQYLPQAPWKIQGQIGFSLGSLETCLIDYATKMNSNNGIVTSIPVCKAADNPNKNSVGQIEVDYYTRWNGHSNDEASFVRWVNRLNYNTSIGATWGNVY